MLSEDEPRPELKNLFLTSDEDDQTSEFFPRMTTIDILVEDDQKDIPVYFGLENYLNNFMKNGKDMIMPSLLEACKKIEKDEYDN